MLKVITFDIGNTIYNTSGKSKLEMLEEIINLPKQVFKNDYKEIFCTSKISLDDMIEKFCRIYDFKEKDKIKKLFLEKSQIEINDKMKNLIEFLHNEGYKIATLSNACLWTYNSIRNTCLTQFIDKEFYSFDIGYVKPNQEIFNAVKQYYNVLPSEILHIGDSKNSDYIAAKKCNWNAFLLNNNILDIYPFINNLKMEENHYEKH